MSNLKTDKNGLTAGQKQWADDEVGQTLTIAVRVAGWKPGEDGRIITTVEAVDGTGTIDLEPRLPPMTPEEIAAYEADAAVEAQRIELAERAAAEAEADRQAELLAKREEELEAARVRADEHAAAQIR